MNPELYYLARALDTPEILYTHPVPEHWFWSSEHKAAHQVIRDLAEDGRCSRLNFAHCDGFRDLALRIPNSWEYEPTQILSAFQESVARRSLRSIGQRLEKQAQDAANDWQLLRDAARDALNGLEIDFAADQGVRLGVVLENARTAILEAQEHGCRGIGTGFPLLDRVIGSLEAGKLYLVAGRPGEGKSAFALQVAAYASSYVPVYVSSLEMSDFQLACRLFSGETRIDSMDLRRKGRLNEDQRAKLAKAVNDLGSRTLYLDTRAGITVERLRGDILRRASRGNIGLVVIDYLQLLRSDNASEGRVQELGVVAMTLKQLAKELSCPVLAAVQLNRGVASDNSEPGLHHLRGSGELEQAADVVITLFRPDEKDRTRIKITIRKNRDGSLGHFFASFKPEFTLFE